MRVSLFFVDVRLQKLHWPDAIIYRQA
ncbi:uncharacterized protein METZ01_LOCUS490595, partial [marine metagenome]